MTGSFSRIVLRVVENVHIDVDTTYAALNAIQTANHDTVQMYYMVHPPLVFPFPYDPWEADDDE